MDILEVIVFKGAVTRLMEMDEDGHDLARMHFVRMMPRPFALSQQASLPLLAVVLLKIIDITKQIKYAHTVTS